MDINPPRLAPVKKYTVKHDASNRILMRSRTSSRSHDVSPYPMVSCVAGAREKFQERLPPGCRYLIKLFLLSLWLVCWCIDVRPSNAAESAWISAARAAVEAPYLAVPPISLARPKSITVAAAATTTTECENTFFYKKLRYVSCEYDRVNG